jgi:hypothetical protein
MALNTDAQGARSSGFAGTRRVLWFEIQASCYARRSGRRLVSFGGAAYTGAKLFGGFLLALPRAVCLRSPEEATPLALDSPGETAEPLPVSSNNRGEWEQAVQTSSTAG